MRVLLATDGSEQAQAATAWLPTVPLPRPSTVRVLAIVAPARGLPALLEGRDDRRRLHEHAGRIVSEAQGTLVGCGADVETQVAEGDPREEIVRMAEEWSADLVVLGARGLGPLSRALLGSVSTAVVRHAPCAVLVMRGRRPGLGTIVLAVDGSPDSLDAAAFLGALPLAPGVRLTLVAVVVPPPALPAPEAATGPLFLDEALTLGQAEAERALDRAQSRVGTAGGTLERRTLIGEAGEEIVSTARLLEADLVTVGARGHGVFKRLLLGSVSEYVLHHAECAVLVVRGRS